MARSNSLARAPKSKPAAPEQDVSARILENALELFGTVGFDGMSMQALARRCGVSTALIHYHFASKLKLWKNAVDYGMRDAAAALSMSAKEMKDIDPLDRLKIFMRRYVYYFASRPSLFSIIVKESDVHGPRFLWLQKNYLKSFYALTNDVVAGAQNAGRIRKDAPSYHLSLIIVGACHHFLSSRHRALPLYGVDPSAETLVDSHADLVVDVIINGITAAR
jgi:AcrR family transcriptional regulator